MFWLLYKQLAQTVQLCNCIVLSQYWIPFLFWGPLLSWSQCSSCPSLTLWLERGKWSHHAPIWPEGLLQLHSFHQFHCLTAPKPTLLKLDYLTKLFMSKLTCVICVLATDNAFLNIWVGYLSACAHLTGWLLKLHNSHPDPLINHPCLSEAHKPPRCLQVLLVSRTSWTSPSTKRAWWAGSIFFITQSLHDATSF